MTFIILGILGFAALLLGILFWNKPILLTYGVIAFCFVSDLFVSFLGLPDSIRYVADLLSVYLMLVGVLKELGTPNKLHAGVPLGIIVLLGLVSVMSFLVNEYSIVTFGIGVFQFFRGFCFYFACICILQKEDVKRMTKIFIFAAFANLAVSLAEYVLFGAKWDNNGGLFGIIVGCNGKMNLYLIIVTAIVAVLYLNKKLSTFMTAGVLGCCLVAATISELKIYYVEMILCIALAVLFSKPSKKTIVFVVGGGVAIVGAVYVLGIIYPLFANFFSLETMLEYSTGDYGNSEGSVNRLSGVTIMLTEYMHLPAQKMFGIGMGNAHEGTAFYNQFEYLKYTYFYSAYLVTELGIVGLVTFVAFFVSNGVIAVISSFRNKEDSEYYLISGIVAVLAILLMIYDASLITATSYLLYFWLAVPYILKKRPRYGR